jgi:hypothetical protein
MRRGPSNWWHLTLWDTRQDGFTSDQWFHGCLYPQKCDLAANGKLFSYFAAKRWSRSPYRTWIAVSRPHISQRWHCGQ